MSEIESEKVLETKLKNGVEKMGGYCIKILCTHLTGLPDRLCLLPGGKIFFAEIKTTKKKAKPMQRVWSARFKKIGFDVFLIDTSVQIKKILENVKRE